MSRCFAATEGTLHQCLHVLTILNKYRYTGMYTDRPIHSIGVFSEVAEMRLLVYHWKGKFLYLRIAVYSFLRNPLKVSTNFNLENFTNQWIQRDLFSIKVTELKSWPNTQCSIKYQKRLPKIDYQKCPQSQQISVQYSSPRILLSFATCTSSAHFLNARHNNWINKLSESQLTADCSRKRTSSCQSNGCEE